jgi:hypothetical protein
MNSLPRTVRQLAEIIGEDAAVQLSGLACNRQLYVPHNMSASHPIAQAIGPSAAAELHRHYRGELVSLAERAARRQAIAQAIAGGLPIHALTERFGITARRARQLIAKRRSEEGDDRAYGVKADRGQREGQNAPFGR